jgi:hypothetical protein
MGALRYSDTPYSDTFFDMDEGVEGGEDEVGGAGFLAEHFGVPGFDGDALFHGDGVVDGEEAVAFFLGDAIAVGEEGAVVADSFFGAGFEDFEEAPFDDGGIFLFGLLEDLVHESPGGVEGGEGLDGSADGVAGFGFRVSGWGIILVREQGAGDELGGLPDLGVEEFDFVAAEFLDAEASDGALGLGEDGGGGAGKEGESSGVLAAVGDEIGGDVEEVGEEVFPHSEGLVEGSAEDSDGGWGFVEEVEEGGECGEACFAAATGRPDDEVGGGFEVGLEEVVEGGVMVGADGGAGDVEIEEEGDPGVEVIGGPEWAEEGLFIGNEGVSFHGCSFRFQR